MRDINSMSRGNVFAPNRRNSVPCTAQLGLPDKCRAIKGLVVCNNWDLEPWDLPNGLALVCYQLSPEVFQINEQRENLSIIVKYVVYKRKLNARFIFVWKRQK